MILVRLAGSNRSFSLSAANVWPLAKSSKMYPRPGILGGGGMGIAGGARSAAAGTGGAIVGGGSFLPHATRLRATTIISEADSFFMSLLDEFSGRNGAAGYGGVEILTASTGQV